MCGEIFLLGKHFSKVNNIFESNESSSIIFGTLIYFTITFLTFFIFIWFNPSITYYVVLFFIKEILQIIYLFTKRDSFKKIKINWFHVIFMFFSMLFFPILFNGILNNYLNLKIQEQNNTFQMWILYKKIIANFTNINYLFLSKWVFSTIAIFIIYNAISSFVIEYSKMKNWLDYFISFLMTFFFLTTSNFGWSIDSMIGIYLILFAIQIAFNIILYSRRRYGLIYGMIVLNIWFLEPRLFLTISMLGILVGFIYTIYSGQKASLFWVQILSPILIILSLWIYPLSSMGALTLTVIAFISYLFIILFGHLVILEKIDIKLNKVKIIMPLIILVCLFSTSIYLLINSKKSFIDLILLDEAIIDSFNNNIWNLIQGIIYYLIVFILCILLIYLWIKNIKIIKHKIIFLIVFTFILVFYNFLFYSLLNLTSIKNQFIYFRIVAFMPLMLLFLIVIKRKIINIKKENITWSEKLSIKK